LAKCSLLRAKKIQCQPVTFNATVRRVWRYPWNIEITDRTPGWKLGARVLPRGYTITVNKVFRIRGDVPAREPRATAELLSDADHDALRRGEYAGAEGNTGWILGETDWLKLDITSSPTQPPRCVTLHAPGGIGTPEQRFPLAGILAEASAAIASKNGSFELG
jgi:hypothetical protein